MRQMIAVATPKGSRQNIKKIKQKFLFFIIVQWMSSSLISGLGSEIPHHD